MRQLFPANFQMLLTLLAPLVNEVYINLLIQPLYANRVYQTYFLKWLFQTIPFHTAGPQLPQDQVGAASEYTFHRIISSHLLSKHKLGASLLKLIFLGHGRVAHLVRVLS